MRVPNIGELLVDETSENTLRRVLVMAYESKDLDELKAKLKDLLNSK